jgi:lysophospholipase L1-like esterase
MPEAEFGDVADAQRRQRWLKILVPVLTLLVMFVLLEGAFRVAERLATRPRAETWAIYDPDLGYRLNPQFGDTSPEGLRDHPVAPKAGRFRVLMLGDSLGYYGDSVDDTWVGRMRQELAQSNSGRLDVLNASIRGYTNYQELAFLEKFGVAFQPDLVGVGFVLNDLHRILHSFKLQDGQIVGETYDFTPEAVDSVDNAAFRLARRSRVLVWLRRTLDPALGSLQYSLGKGFSFDYRPDMNTAWKEASWADVGSQMREMQALGREHGFGLFMVVFPFADQYRPEYLAADRDYVLKPQRLALELCAELAIPCLDMYDRLTPVDFEEDGIHLTAAGRQRAAEHVARFLVEEGLVPPKP